MEMSIWDHIIPFGRHDEAGKLIITKINTNSKETMPNSTDDDSVARKTFETPMNSDK